MQLFKKVLFLSIPFLFLLGTYLYTDPSKKIWNYKTYLYDYLMLNRGDISTRVYLKNKNTFNYNSFIFGSSRSCAYTSKEWKKYLSIEDIPYSYGSWNDPIKGMYKKIALIDSLKGHIKNAIIIIDLDKTFQKSETKNIYSDHYLISGISKFNYFLSDFRQYLRNPRLVITSLDYKLFKKKRHYMKGFVGMKKGDLDPINNDWRNKDIDLIDSASYEKNKEKFYIRSIKERYSVSQIFSYEKLLLLKISYLFQKHNTNCKIIISPLYDQIKINQDDLLILQKIFGPRNVFDYSGINYITNNKYNYSIDVIHYKKRIGNLIFKEIYKP